MCHFFSSSPHLGGFFIWCVPPSLAFSQVFLSTWIHSYPEILISSSTPLLLPLLASSHNCFPEVLCMFVRLRATQKQMKEILSLLSIFRQTRVISQWQETSLTGSGRAWAVPQIRSWPQVLFQNCSKLSSRGVQLMSSFSSSSAVCGQTISVFASKAAVLCFYYARCMNEMLETRDSRQPEVSPQGGILWAFFAKKK